MKSCKWSRWICIHGDHYQRNHSHMCMMYDYESVSCWSEDFKISKWFWETMSTFKTRSPSPLIGKFFNNSMSNPLLFLYFCFSLQTCACLSTIVTQVRLSVFFHFWKDVLIPLLQFDSLGLKPVIVVCFSSDEQIHEVLNQAVVSSLPNSNPSVRTLQRGVVVCLYMCCC